MHIYYNMAFSILAFLLLSISTKSSADYVTDFFINCLSSRSESNFPVTENIYTPNNSSFSSTYQAYIRNPRFYNSTRRKPSLIVTPTHVSHIQNSVVCAREHGMQMRTRCGGHDYEGLSYLSFDEATPFFILDMFNLRSVDVNIEQEIARVQTGATLGEVYYKISEKSNTHALPAGVCPTVAVGGHCSGAGYGNMIRKYGLTVDLIQDAELIDVNGRLLDRKSMGEDLFWAITGGGGASFGVVLSFTFKLVQVPPQVTFFNLERTSEDDIINIANKWFQTANKLDNNLFIRMRFNVINDTKENKTILARFRSLFLGNTTTLMSLMEKSHPMGTSKDALLSRSQQSKRNRPFKIKSDFLKSPISKHGMESIFNKMKELKNQMITFNPLGGRMNEISEFAKPYPHRAGNLAKIEYETYWEDAGTEAANQYLQYARLMHEHMTPYVSKNPREAFFNYRDLDIGVNHNGKISYEEGKVYGVKYWKEVNFERLVLVKSIVDPDNFFRNEQGIPTLESII
ncbi:berberine bridge enzyme-like protein 8 [Tanacetum coccineum]